MLLAATPGREIRLRQNVDDPKHLRNKTEPVTESAGVHGKPVGMPAKRLRHISFAVGSGLVGISAMLIGLNVGIIDSNMGSDIILMATVAMIIGGLGNVGAAAGGGFVLGVIQNVAIWKIESKWQLALSFGILILVLLFRPHGLFGEKSSEEV